MSKMNLNMDLQCISATMLLTAPPGKVKESGQTSLVWRLFLPTHWESVVSGLVVGKLVYSAEAVQAVVQDKIFLFRYICTMVCIESRFKVRFNLFNCNSNFTMTRWQNFMSLVAVQLCD